MVVIDRSGVESYVSDLLGEISYRQLPMHQHSCPHCGIMVRYPTVAREQDLKDFELIINTAMRVMDTYNISGNLLAEIRTACLIEIVKRNSKGGKS